MPKDEMKRMEKYSAARQVPYIASNGNMDFMPAKKLAKKNRKKYAPKKVAGK